MCLLKVSQSHGNSSALRVSLGDEALAEACRALQEGLDAFGLLPAAAAGAAGVRGRPLGLRDPPQIKP